MLYAGVRECRKPNSLHVCGASFFQCAHALSLSLRNAPLPPCAAALVVVADDASATTAACRFGGVCLHLVALAANSQHLLSVPFSHSSVCRQNAPATSASALRYFERCVFLFSLVFCLQRIVKIFKSR